MTSPRATARPANSLSAGNEERDSPVFSYLPHPSLIDFESHIAAVFFKSGCNFRCRFCHNASLVACRRERVSWENLAAVCDRFESNWVDAAVLTGGEPTLAPDLGRLVRFLKGRGWAVKLDTNGSNPAALASLLPELDYVAMDVKAGLSRYPGLTGFARTELLLSSIRLLRTRARDYEFRTTIVRAVHTDEHMHEIGALIQGARRYVLQPFVPRPGLLDPAFESQPRTPLERLQELQALMRPYAEEIIVRGA